MFKRYIGDRAFYRRVLAVAVPIIIQNAITNFVSLLYNTTGEIRRLASRLIIISAVMMPFNAFTNGAYFTLRSGGQTFVTFLFDSCFVWALCVPLAFCLSRFTGFSISGSAEKPRYRRPHRQNQ